MATTKRNNEMLIIVLSGHFQSGISDVVVEKEHILQTTTSGEVEPLIDETDDAVDHNASLEALSLGAILDRKYLFYPDVSVLTTQTIGQVITDFFLPNTFFSKYAPKGLASYHYVFRGDFQVHVQMNSCQFAAGMLIVFWAPVNANILGTSVSLASLTQLPHAFIKIGRDTLVTLNCPWPLNQRLATPTSNVGRVRIAVWNPLMVASSAPPQVEYSVYVSCKRAYMGGKIIQQMSTKKSTARKSFKEIAQGVAADYKATTHTGIITSLMDSVGLSGISSFLGDIFSFAPFFDSPSVIEHNGSALACTDVPRSVLHCGFSQDEEVDDQNKVFSNHNMMPNIIERCRVLTRIATVTWSTTTPVGMLLQIPLTPLFAQYSAAPISSGSSTYGVEVQSTPLSYFSQFYQLWRGDFVLTFEIIGTQFHNGQLLIAYTPQPGQVAWNAGVYNCAHAVMDARGDERLSIRCPFVSAADYLSTSFPNTSSTSSGQWAGINVSTFFANTTGNVVLAVQNQLSCPSAVSSSIVVNVYIEAGENFEFKVPINHRANGTYVAYAGQYQMDITPSDPAVAKSHTLDVVARRSYKPSYIANPHTDVRQMMKRASYVTGGTVNVSAMASSGNWTAFCQGPLVAGVETFILTIPWAYFSGAVRALMVTSINKTQSVCIAAIPSFRNQASAWNPAYAQSVSPTDLYANANIATPNDCGEFIFEVPYYCPYPAKALSPIIFNPAVNGTITFCYGCAPAAMTFSYQLFVSYGDDVQVYWPLPLPKTSNYYHSALLSHDRDVEIETEASEEQFEQITLSGHHQIDFFVDDVMKEVEEVVLERCDLSNREDRPVLTGHHQHCVEYVKCRRTVRDVCVEVQNDMELGAGVGVEEEIASDEDEPPDESDIHEMAADEDELHDESDTQSGLDDDEQEYVDALRCMLLYRQDFYKPCWKEKCGDLVPILGRASGKPYFCLRGALGGFAHKNCLCVFCAMYESVETNLTALHSMGHYELVWDAYADAHRELVERAVSWYDSKVTEMASVDPSLLDLPMQYLFGSRGESFWPIRDKGALAWLFPMYQIDFDHTDQADLAYTGMRQGWMDVGYIFISGCYHYKSRLEDCRAVRRRVEERRVVELEEGDLANLFASGVHQNFLDSASDIFDNIKQLLTNICAMVASPVTSVLDTAVNRAADAVETSIWKSINKIAAVMMDDLLPIITGVNMALTTTGVSSMLGCAQVLRVLTRYLGGAPQPLQPHGIKGVHQMNSTTLFEKLCSSRSPAFAFCFRDKLIGWAGSILSSCGFLLSSKCALYLNRMVPAEDPLYLRCVKYAWYLVAYIFLGDSANAEWEREQTLAISRRLTEIEELHSKGKFEMRDINKMHSGGLSYISLLRETGKMVRKYRDLVAEMSIPPSIAQRIVKFFELLSEVERKSRVAATRAEPVGIFLRGDPGVGKSLIVSSFLPSMVLPIVEHTPYSSDQVYACPYGEQQFWDGYHQQPWVYMDEAFQEADSQDPGKILRCVSTGVMHTNQANLSDKGMTFDSKFFVVCSNVKNLHPLNTILDKEPFYRRLQAFTLVVKNAWIKAGVLNSAALSDAVKNVSSRGELLDLFNSVWYFQGHDLKNGSSTSVSFSFSEFVDLLVSRSQQNTATFKIFSQVVGKLEGLHQMDVCHEDDEPLLEERRERYVLGIAESYALARDQHDEMYHNIMSTVGTSDSGWIELVDVWKLFPGVETLREQGEQFPYQLCDGKRPVKCERHEAKDLAQLMDAIWAKHRTTGKKRTVWEGIVSFFRKFSATAAVIVSLVALAGKLIISYFTGSLCTSQAYDSSKVTRKKFERLDPSKIQLQLDTDQVERIRNNMREIIFHAEETKTYVCRCGTSARRCISCTKVVEKVKAEVRGSVQVLFINSRTFIFPWHFMRKIQTLRAEGQIVRVYVSVLDQYGKAIKVLPISGSIHEYTQLSYDGETSDAGLYHMPLQVMPRVRDIESFIQEAPIPSDATYLNGKKLDGIILGTPYSHRNFDIPIILEQYVAVELDESTYIRCRGGEATVDGDCGRPYIRSAYYNKPIIGIHSFQADCGDIACAPFDQSSILEAKYKLQKIWRDTQTIEDQPMSVEKYQGKYWTSSTQSVVGKVVLHGVIDLPVVVHSPVVSNLTPIVFNGRKVLSPELEKHCDYKPVIMRSSESVHPILTHAQKYGSIQKFIPGVSTHDKFVRHYAKKLPVSVYGEVSWYDVINGFAGLTQLAMDTGIGFWNLLGFKEMQGPKGKRQFFEELPTEGNDMKTYTFSQKAKTWIVPFYGVTFVERLEQMVEMLESGTVPFSVWITTVKDELRPAEKVVAMKNRVFDQMDLATYFCVRKYFGEFLGWFRTNPGFAISSAIGIDKEAVWHLIWRGLKRNSNVGFACDQSGWDGNVFPAAFQFFEDVVDCFYQSKNDARARARHALLYSIVHAVHVGGDVVYLSDQGNKSGNPMTDVLNTVCNVYVGYITWALARSGEGLEVDLDVYDQYVKVLYYGDDSIFSVHPSVGRYFNAAVYAKACESVGMKVTDDKKTTGEMVPLRKLEQLTFLKSEFVVRDEIVYCPMPFKDILKELKYRKAGLSHDLTDLALRVQNVMRFLSHHGDAMVAWFQNEERGFVPSEMLGYDYVAFVDDIREKQSVASFG